MKDEKHIVDDLFKDRLYNVESDVQPKSWDAISKKINTKSSFLIKKWFYGIGFACTVIAVVTYFVYTGNAGESEYKEMHPSELTEIKIETDPIDSIRTNDQHKNKESEIKQNEILSTASVQQLISSLDERKAVQLPDGSEVLLNRNSSVSYSTLFLTDRTIHVSGEVFVKVAAGNNKKLILISNFSKVEAFEASFIIKSDYAAGYDEVFVSSGKVDCKSLVVNANRMPIFAGNNAIINKEGHFKEHTIQDVNYNDWVTQKIVFNNTSLNIVFETLEQYYNVSLKADNVEIMNCHFTGTFERNNINEILQVLSVSFNLSFNQKSKEYILSGKGCK